MPCPEVIPRLHLVTDDHILADSSFVTRAAQVCEAGFGPLALHLRGPGTSGRALWTTGSVLLPLARAAGVTLVVNDRVDLALGLGADGVHLGTRSLPAREARDLLGPKACIGVSVHGRDEARGLVGAPADFVFAGSLYATVSHPERSPGGVGRLSEVRGELPHVPVIGIGGVTLERVNEVLAEGAHGVAVRGAVWDSPHPAEVVQNFVRALDQPPGPGAHSLSLTVNGVPRSVPARTTVSGLLESLGLAPATIVVERNLAILDRKAYGNTELQAGDHLELVHFVGGG